MRETSRDVIDAVQVSALLSCGYRKHTEIRGFERQETETTRGARMC